MFCIMKRSAQLLLLSFMTGVVWSSVAAPLERADLPEHPAWLLHFDWDALRQTHFGQYLLYEWDKPEVYSNIVSFQSIFGFDFRTHLHGITVYGRDPNRKDGIIIIYANLDPGHLAAMLKGKEGAETTTNNLHVIHSWIDKQQNAGPDGEGRGYAVILNNRLLMAYRKEDILSALAVMDGAAPNLSAGKLWAEGAIADGPTFAEATTTNLDFLGSSSTAALLKPARQVNFQAGETKQQFNASLTAKTGDEDTAKKMLFAVQGLVALLSLQKDAPEAARLATFITVKQNGATVTATFSMPSTDLIATSRAYFSKNGKPAKN